MCVRLAACLISAIFLKRHGGGGGDGGYGKKILPEGLD